MALHNIKISKTARYFTLGDLTARTKTILFVLHGYGFLASEFIKNFEFLDNSENYVIAPEALNKFYVKGFSGKIGASWMTKEDRSNEINDYVSFLDNVYAKEVAADRNVKIIVIGFSQGTATAVRWHLFGSSHIDHLILWGGGITKDAAQSVHAAKLNSVPIRIIIGDSDRFVPDEKLRDDLTKYKEAGINFHYESFEGGHEIKADVLQKIMKEIE